MKVRNIIFAFLLSFSFLFQTSKPEVVAENIVNIYFFYDKACAHCYEENLYLDELEETYSFIRVFRYEITDYPENQTLFEEVKQVFSEESVLTPYTVIGGVTLKGFSEQTKQDIEKLITRYHNADFTDIMSKIFSGEPILEDDFDSLEFESGDLVYIPIIGPVEIEKVSLLLSGIVIGFVDGFNPCAMWVLLFLITMLINTKNKKKMWIIGLTFLFTSALFYFLMMVAWLNIAIHITAIQWIRFLIGLFAMSFGSYHVYTYLKKKKQDEIGCEVTDQTKRRKLVEKIKKIVLEEKLIFALLGVIVLAISVNIVELACSAGLPLLYTQILAYNDLPMASYYGYIFIYVLFFLIDDLIVFTIAMITLQVTGISNKYTKLSHLIGGIIMLIIGFLLIFFPSIIMFNL